MKEENMRQASITDNRTDMTDWIIHFTRNHDALSAHESLERILYTGKLKPGYSIRKDKTTLYGDQPVICFTEMPLYNFAKYVQSRKDLSGCSPYGICMQKRELYEAGGRPVIYGLSDSQPEYHVLIKDEMTYRLLPEKVLPKQEQYRYVAYDPNRSPYSLDWTHEREWRWKADASDQQQQTWGENGPELALPLFRAKNKGGYFSSLGIIVWSQREAEDIAQKLLLLQDADHNNVFMPFDAEVIAKTHIIMLEKVVEEVEVKKNRRANRVEEILSCSSTIFPLSRPRPSQAVLQLVKDTVIEAKKAATQAASQKYEAAPKDTHGIVLDVCGFAYVVTEESHTEITQALVELGLAHAMVKDTIQHYKIRALGELPCTQGLSIEEAAAEAAAAVLTETLHQQFFVYSVWD
ncbi:MAG TPA: hypothetical protein VFV38_00030 [Ktedonobacteraceae bacterium]|nr:hypothetical protein [Ktedonobacteraceae bacterium]